MTDEHTLEGGPITDEERAGWARYGCEGESEYLGCHRMSHDYARLLATIARVEALAGDWERMAAEDDPEAARWFRYAARNVRGRLQEPPAALAEPGRDEEAGA